MAEKYTKTVERIKRKLNSAMLLTHLNLSWPFVLEADVSYTEVGVIIYHERSDGTINLITCASKMLNQTQRTYGHIFKFQRVRLQSFNS